MTEQQACTLCGAGGHTAAQCNWNDRRLTFTLESLTEALGNVVCLHELGVELIAANVFRQHPEQAEGAQGEREAFEAHESRERRLPPADQKFWFRRGVLADYDCKAIDDAWKAWKARAALAQPSPELIDASAERNAMQRQRDNALGLLERECNDADELLRLMGLEPDQYRTEGGSINLPKVRAAQPSPAPDHFTHADKKLEALLNATALIFESPGHDAAHYWAECMREYDEAHSPAPELERPEVVAWQYRVTAGPQTGWSLWHPGKGEEYERSYTVERRPLMTVAQHDRIVGALRAERDGAIKLLGQSVWQKFEQLTQERDAAQARVAELEQSQGAEVFLTMTGEITQLKAKLAELEAQEPVAFVVDVQGYKRLICASREEAVSNAEHFEKRGRKSPITALYAAPVAQAGQVPEGWKLVPIKLTAEMVNGAWNEPSTGHINDIERVWAGALAAAPAQGGE
ncbi:hypothetical protein [Pseudomonas nitroreducens]|uniref:hypothetical protein n=1 Tax=Pseudomonas nitroreducens TaxID=46680 RepID=UPI003CC82BD9